MRNGEEWGGPDGGRRGWGGGEQGGPEAPGSTVAPAGPPEHAPAAISSAPNASLLSRFTDEETEAPGDQVSCSRHQLGGAQPAEPSEARQGLRREAPRTEGYMPQPAPQT